MTNNMWGCGLERWVVVVRRGRGCWGAGITVQEASTHTIHTVINVEYNNMRLFQKNKQTH